MDITEIDKQTEIITQPTVESYLRAVNYKEDVNYKPSDFALEFITFIKLVNGEKGEEHKTPVIHYKMLDQLVGGEDNIANMCARGTAKTTLLAEYLYLYLGVYGDLPNFGEVNYALYVSDSIENGVKKMRLRLERRRENSPFLMSYLPKARFTDIRWHFWNADGKEFVVTGHGAKTGVRGTVELNTRPQLAVLDDLLSDEDARSATVISSIEDTVDKAIEHALHPTQQKVIWSGTPFNAKDPFYKAVESGAYAVNVYPICEKFPCTEEEFVGAWPDRFPYSFVEKKYNKARLKGRINTFNQELMLRIMSTEDRLIQDKEIRWYRRDLITKNKGRFNFYITTDFAVSDTESSDYSVISVWALNSRGQWFWVDGICKKQLMDRNMNDLFRLAQKWKPEQVGIEVSGQQKGFVAWIQNEQLAKNIWFNLASEGNKGEPGIKPTTNKMVRFNIVLPYFKGYNIFFPVEMEKSPIMLEMYDELTLASPYGFKSKHDDFIDSISQLGSLTTFRPSEEHNVIPGENDIWEDEEDEDNASWKNSYIV